MDTELLKADLLIRHGKVLTMDAERRILTDGAVAIRQGRIVAIGPDREVVPRVSASHIRDVGGALVHPGFVDAHVHPIQDLTRSLEPEGVAFDGHLDFGARFFGSVTREEEYLAVLLSCMEMVANGTTLYADTGSSFDLEGTAKAINEVGLRGIPGYYISDVTPIDCLRNSTEECVRKLTEQLERYPFHSDNRVRCAVTLSGMGWCSDRLLVEAKALVDRYQVPMIIHQSWGEDEVIESLKRYGKRPIEHLADLGILGPHLTLVHMNWLDEREIELVAKSGACVVHCPSAGIYRAVGTLRAGRFPEMLQAGIPVALGSDGPNGRHDVTRMAYLAALLFKEIRGQVPMITAAMALEMATVHGARVLGMQDEVGSLEVGKRADLVIHTLNRPEPHPRHNPVTNLIYSSVSRTVDTVFVGGEVIYEGGRFTRFDAQEAYKRIDAAGEAIKKRIGASIKPAWPIVE